MDTDYDWEITDELLIQHATKLFLKPDFLFDEYTLEQIEQGFRFIPIVGDLELVVWDKKVALSIRQECIVSMVNLFERVFMKNSLGDVTFMWWDSFRSFEDEPEWEIREVIFNSLTKIIKMDSVICQNSALHGFGHLEHNGKKKVIEQFLETHPSIDADTREYALAAIEGKVL